MDIGHRDGDLAKMARGADPGQQQQVGGGHGAGRQDDFTARSYAFHGAEGAVLDSRTSSLIDQQAISHLINERKTSCIATTFQSSWDQLPEPLVTIWEPKSYSLLLSFLSQGYSCPRKVLLNNDVHIINATHPDALLNVNTPEEAEKAKQILREKTVSS